MGGKRESPARPTASPLGSGGNPSVGSTGNIKSGQISTDGQQISFLPGKETYTGRKGGGPTKSGQGASTEHVQGYPFAPSKPEGTKGKK